MTTTTTHRALALAGAAFSGSLLAVQSRMNGEISRATGQPMEAALWSFGSGLVLLFIGLAVTPSMRAGVTRIVQAVRSGRLRWWQCLGGVSGGVMVAVQAWSVPLIGVAIFSVALVGGQTLAGVVVDRFGVGPSGMHQINGLRLSAAFLAVAGVLLSATSRQGGGDLSFVPGLAAFGVGAAMAFQQAFNGRVSVASRSSMATTWQNFLFGTVTLALISLVVLMRTGAAAWSWPADVPSWALFGGVLGIIFIAITAWAVRIIGVLTFGLVAVAGQLVAALVLDLIDETARSHIGPQMLAGLGLTLLAALVAGAFSR